ncbi:MAG: DoxX family protein [Candidatus Acidiferrales bacterium]
MDSTMEAASVSGASVWSGRIVSAIVVLFMLFDSITKILKVQQVIDATVRIGFPVNTIMGIGVTLLICTILYVIPRTSVLGAILLTAYLGGATAANVRAASPALNLSFPIIFGVLVWLGLFLRESRLRALIPLKS